MSVPDTGVIGLLAAAPIVTSIVGANLEGADALVNASSGGALLVMGLYLSRRIQDESARTREILAELVREVRKQ